MSKRTDKLIGEVVKLLNSHFPDIKATNKWLARLVSGDGYVKVIKREGKVAAYAIVSSSAEDSTLEYIGVKKEYRQEGLGKELLESVVDFERKRGCSLDTYVSVSNIPSLNMFISFGNWKIKRITSRWVFFELD